MRNLGRGARALLTLGLLCGQATGCLPSDFNTLKRESESARAQCDAQSCTDSSSDGAHAPASDASARCEFPECLDAGAPTPPGADAAGEGEQAGKRDASTMHEPAVGHDGAVQRDASSSAEPDARMPMPPLPCGGAAPVCTPDQVETAQEACGDCGSGTRTRTRQCAADGCSMGAWGAWSACTGEHTECDPQGAAQTRSVACPTCGSKSQKRTCSTNTCKWNAWTDTSACSWCEQCSEVVYCDTPANIANRGTWCRQKACSREQALSDCKEDVKNVCGAMVQPFYMQYE